MRGRTPPKTWPPSCSRVPPSLPARAAITAVRQFQIKEGRAAGSGLRRSDRTKASSFSDLGSLAAKPARRAEIRLLRSAVRGRAAAFRGDAVIEWQEFDAKTASRRDAGKTRRTREQSALSRLAVDRGDAAAAPVTAEDITRAGELVSIEPAIFGKGNEARGGAGTLASGRRTK